MHRRTGIPACPDGATETPEPQAAFVVAAFEQVLCRQPTTSELDRSLAFLGRQQRLFAGDKASAAARARSNLVQVLFNHNDFLTIH